MLVLAVMVHMHKYAPMVSRPSHPYLGQAVHPGAGERINGPMPPDFCGRKPV